MSQVITTVSGTGLNLSSEVAIGANYPATFDGFIQPVVALSNLNGAAATFTFKFRIYAADGTTLLSENLAGYHVKQTAANTKIDDKFDPIWLNSGEILQLRVLSSNGNDSPIAYSVKYIDPALVKATDTDNARLANSGQAAAIKNKTDQLTFTVPNKVDASASSGRSITLSQRNVEVR